MSEPELPDSCLGLPVRDIKTYKPLIALVGIPNIC